MKKTNHPKPKDIPFTLTFEELEPNKGPKSLSAF